MKNRLKIVVQSKISPLAAEIKITREVPAMPMRQFRAYLHQAWIAGNESYNLPHEKVGFEERQDFLDQLCLREGFVKPVVNV